MAAASSSLRTTCSRSRPTIGGARLMDRSMARSSATTRLACAFCALLPAEAGIVPIQGRTGALPGSHRLHRRAKARDLHLVVVVVNRGAHHLGQSPRFHV